MIDLNAARDKVRWLDEMRLARAIQDAPPAIETVLHLLPLMFHCNHPSFVGFVKDCPQGIAQFSLNDKQKSFLEQRFPTIPIQKVCQIINANDPQTEISFCGLYAMGSIGSVSQTPCSDLDLWLCVREDMPAHLAQLVQQKITLLQEWALGLGVKISLYLIDQKRFRHSHYAQPLSDREDNSGSAQYMLLLDEFYRTAIRLAGKPLLWLHLAVEKEQDYNFVVESLIEKGELNIEEWTDFGGLGELSANEYFGATLWQLYKGIDSPYKSALKILLLESYTSHYPNTKLISQQFKYQLLNGDQNYHYDAYLCMLEWVAHFLSRNEDQARLNFAYRCFYLKVRENCPKHQDIRQNWRLQVLQDLTKKWGWSEDFVQFLNDRPNWRIKLLKQNHNDLLHYLMASYRNLLQFVRKHKVNAQIVPQDMAILSRKLYTAFEELPGKVIFVNATNGRDLRERALTLLEVNNNPNFKSGWYLLNHSPTLKGLESQSHLQRHSEFGETLPKIVAWAYFNGLLTRKTQLYLKSEQVKLSALRQFAQDLCRSFPKTPSPSQQEYIRHCKIRQLMVAINLSHDETSALSQDDTLQKANLSEKLLYWDKKTTPLISSIDAIYRNRWGEIRTLHFAGEDALLRLLKVLTHKIPRASTSLQSVQIFNYSQHFQKELRLAVQDLIYRTLGIESKTVKSSNTSSIIYDQSQGFQPLFQGIRQTNKYDYPKELAPFASEGFLQFFFEDNEDGSFNVFILNEYNHLEVYRHCLGDKKAKINEINRLYQVASLNSKDNPYKIVRYHFNYPQFYQLLSTSEKQRQIVPFRHHLSLS